MKYKGYEINVWQSDYNPREDCENETEFIFWDKNYRLGDVQWKCDEVESNLYDRCLIAYYNTNQVIGENENARYYFELLRKYYAIKFIKMYEHSGIALHLIDFDNMDEIYGWDCRIAGCIMIKWSDIHTDDEKMSKVEAADILIRNEFNDYENYIEGEYYEYRIEKGWYAENSEGLHLGEDAAIKDAKATIDEMIHNDVKQMIRYVNDDCFALAEQFIKDKTDLSEYDIENMSAKDIYTKGVVEGIKMCNNIGDYDGVIL